MAASGTLDRARSNGTPPRGVTPPPAKPQVQNEDGDASRYTPAQRWVVLVALLLGTLLEVLDTSIVNVSIPQIMGNLGATLDDIGWISTGYIISNVIILPLTGYFSSLLGRRRYLTYSILLFVLASFLCGHAHSLGELIGFRVMQGAGGAALLSSAQATLLEIFPRRQIAMVQAIFTIGVVFAPTVGPTLGGYITDNLSWPWIFYVNVPIGLVAAFMVWTFLKDSIFQTKPKGGPDLVGIGFLAMGLGSLQFVLERGQTEGWLHSDLIAIFVFFATIGLSCFIYWELSVENPAVHLRVLKNIQFTSGVICSVILGFGLYGAVYILPLFLQDVRGFTATQTGMALFPGGVATVMVLPFIGKAIGKVPTKILVFCGAVLFATAMWKLSYLSIDSSVQDVYAALLVRGVAVSLLFLPLTLASLTALPPKDVPGATGLFNLARQFGGSAGIAYLSTFLDRHQISNYANLSSHINATNPAFQQRFQYYVQFLESKGFSPGVATQKAYAITSNVVHTQASVQSYNEAFQFIAFSFLTILPLTLLFKDRKGGKPVKVDVH